MPASLAAQPCQDYKTITMNIPADVSLLLPLLNLFEIPKLLVQVRCMTMPLQYLLT